MSDDTLRARLRQTEAGLEGHGVGMMALDAALSPRDGEGLIGAARRTVCERDAARALAGRLRRTVLDALLPVGAGAPDPDEALRRLARAAHDVPQEWEPWLPTPSTPAPAPGTEADPTVGPGSTTSLLSGGGREHGDARGGDA